MSEPLTATEPQVAPGTLSIPVPQTIGRFTILNEIGRGSYGVVWAAHDPVLGREVAIKIIPLAREAQFRTQIEANFLREAKSAGAMSHPSIAAEASERTPAASRSTTRARPTRWPTSRWSGCTVRTCTNTCQALTA